MPAALFTAPPPFPTPDSWRENRTLHICSFEARGLWMELLCLMHGPEEIYRPFLNKKTHRLMINHLMILIGSSKRRIYAGLEELIELNIIDPTIWDHPVIPAPRVVKRRGVYVRDKVLHIYRKDPRYAS